VLGTCGDRGKNAVASFFADSDASWESIAFEVEGISDVGEVCVLDARLVGRGRASGANIDAEVTTIVRFVDDKIASWRTFDNRHEALATLDPAP
jgi:ketosteroid isomerase-like protein